MKREREDNFLLYIPSIKHQSWEIRNDCVYLLFEHNKPVERFVRWLVKKQKNTDLQLDAMGSRVWQMMDGRKNVYEIGQNLMVDCGETCQPVYERLNLFLGYLNRKGWIRFQRGNQ